MEDELRSPPVCFGRHSMMRSSLAPSSTSLAGRAGRQAREWGSVQSGGDASGGVHAALPTRPPMALPVQRAGIAPQPLALAGCLALPALTAIAAPPR